MTWRRKPQPLLGFDSVLDLLTNLVGIFVILALFSWLTLGQNAEVKKEIQQYEDQIGALQAEIDEAKRRLRAPPTVGIKKLQKRIAALRSRINASATGSANAALTELSAERERLEAELRQLQSTPLPPAPPPAAVLSLPDPTTTSAGDRKEVAVLVRGGRVYAGYQAWRTKVADELKALAKRAKLSVTDVKRHFDGPRGENKDFNSEAVILPSARKPRALVLRTSVKRGRGESIGQIGASSSDFQRWIRSLDRKKVWIRFRVFDDSFSIYLKARKIVDEAKFQAGWIPYADDEPLQFIIWTRDGQVGTSNLYPTDPD